MEEAGWLQRYNIGPEWRAAVGDIGVLHILRDCCTSLTCVTLSIEAGLQGADAFVTFLRAFRDCQVIRRLDLSGNDFSGPLGMETLLRAYAEQQRVDPSLLHNEASCGKQHSDDDILSDKTNRLSVSPKSRHRLDSSEETTVSGCSLNDGNLVRRRKGLHSIPYIILKNVKLDDAGALHLSYLLEQHHLPQYLMTKLKDGSREAKRKEEDDADGCVGLLYSENPSLSQFGAKVLEYANAARSDLVNAQASTQDSQASWMDPVKITTSPSTRPRKMSFHSEGSDRRVSGSVTTLLSLRKRLQRTTIETHGVHGVELWHAAIKVLYAARVILPSCSREDGNENGTKSAQGKTNGSGTHELQMPPGVKKPFDQDEHNPKNLPTELWKRIIILYAGASDVLSDAQIDNVLAYARDRSNIEGEQHNQARGDAHQVWHVLEHLDCFTYTM